MEEVYIHTGGRGERLSLPLLLSRGLEAELQGELGQHWLAKLHHTYRTYHT